MGDFSVVVVWPYNKPNRKLVSASRLSVNVLEISQYTLCVSIVIACRAILQSGDVILELVTNTCFYLGAFHRNPIIRSDEEGNPTSCSKDIVLSWNVTRLLESLSTHKTTAGLALGNCLTIDLQQIEL